VNFVRIFYLKVGFNVLHGRLGLVPQQGVHGHDDARGAEATLGPVGVGHALLDSVQLGPESTMLTSCKGDRH